MLEADFAQFYGIDPATVSARRLYVLASNLPDRARIFERDGWGIDQELAATTVELLDGVIRALARLGGAKRSKLGRPLRIPRPGERNGKNASKTKKSTARQYFEHFKRIAGG